MEDKIVREVERDIEQLQARFRVTNWAEVPESLRHALAGMCSTLGVPVRFCKLGGCCRPFAASNRGKEHLYCCPNHADKDYNNGRGA